MAKSVEWNSKGGRSIPKRLLQASGIAHWEGLVGGR